MNCLVTLVLLGQIIGCTFSVVLSEEFDCNGEEAKKFGDLAVNYINKHNLHGYKQTLNVIKSVDFLPPRGGVEVVVAIELQLLETVCHVLDPTPIENCTVRQENHHAVKAECLVRIHREKGDKVSGANCHSIPGPVKNVRKDCPKCPILLPLNDPPVVQSVEYVLHKHNEQQPNHVYEVLEISRGQHKYEPEAFYVEFAIVETNCSAQEAHDDHHACHPKAAGEAHIGFCKATVFRSHAVLEKPEQYESDCVIFDVKEGHSHTHLIEHHYGKSIASPGRNNTVLDLVHSHNHTSSSYESHSDEHVVEVAVPVAKREAPTEIAHELKRAPPKCPGKVHHFNV